MKYVIDDSRKKAAYLQLYEQLKSDIVKGGYPYKTKLPSKRTVADETGVSLVTVEHAYGLLCEEGYVESVERSGYFVIFRDVDYFTTAADAGSFVLAEKAVGHDEAEDCESTSCIPASGVSVQQNLVTGVRSMPPYIFPFTVLSRTMRKVMNDYGEGILTKSPNCGCLELRNAISQYLLRSRGIRATADQIVIGSGAEYLYGLVVELLGLERIYGIEAPSYEKIEKVYGASGVTYDLLQLGPDGIDSYALAGTQASVLHITPYRSFPSGITASASKKHEYIRWVHKGSRYIVEDDFESEFSVSRKPEETLFSLSDCKKIIYMNTFSQTISPSMRVGYMVLPDSLVHEFDSKLGFYSCTVPTFEQLVIAELLDSGDFERHINRVRRNKRREQGKVQR